MHGRVLCDPDDLPSFFFFNVILHTGADKRMASGSDNPCEGVATSLRFPSQPGSFSPGNYASEATPGQPDSPIKTSPVSERIKALEALAAKKKELDFRSDGGYSHFRDRHHEKSPTDNPKSPVETTKSSNQSLKCPFEKTTTTQIKECSADQESPDSPFEMLGDLKQVNEFEETEEWMKAHLPPVPDFDSVGLTKSPEHVPSKEKEADIAGSDTSAAFAGVPDVFMDCPIEASVLKDEFDVQKQSILEQEFDLSFLPTAYMWNQQEKSAVPAPSNPDSSVSSPAGFQIPSPPSLSPADTDVKPNVSEDKKTSWTTDTELPEASEADSSGESDDTVIEDGVSPASATTLSASADPALLNHPAVENQTPPPKSERKLMQVPTINVIETDEPNYSDVEMEMDPEAEEDDGYEVVQDPCGEAPKVSEPEDDKPDPLKTRPLETEFMEGYSPPSSPVDSENEYSPKHNVQKSSPKLVSQESHPNPEAPPNSGISKPCESDNRQVAESQKTLNEQSTFTATNEDEDFPDNDEWSDEACNILVKSYQGDLVSKEPTSNTQSMYEKSNAAVTLPKTTFMQDDIYDRQSFDYDYDASSPFDDMDNDGVPTATECFLSDPTALEQKDVAENGHNPDMVTSLIEDLSAQSCQGKYHQDTYSCFQTAGSVSEQESNLKGTVDSSSVVQQDIKAVHHSPDKTGKPEGSTESEPTDSFVDFMRECLKSRQDEEPECPQDGPSENDNIRPSLTPSMVMNLEQEQLTITALKQLGSSQEEEAAATVNPQSSKGLDQDWANLGTTAPQSSIASVTNSPRVLDNTYSKEVEALDEWVAEAYHLAEHVLTAILTHLSGNTSFFSALGLLTSCTPPIELLI